MTPRRCGSCTLCCEVLGIDSPEGGGRVGVASPAGERCEHATDKGCNVYARRPGECRIYRCVWLMDPDVPKYVKPVRSGFVFNLSNDRKRMVVYTRENDTDAWRRGKAGQWLHENTHGMKLVIVGDTKSHSDYRADSYSRMYRANLSSQRKS